MTVKMTLHPYILPGSEFKALEKTLTILFKISPCHWHLVTKPHQQQGNVKKRYGYFPEVDYYSISSVSSRVLLSPTITAVWKQLHMRNVLMVQIVLFIRLQMHLKFLRANRSHTYIYS